MATTVVIQQAATYYPEAFSALCMKRYQMHMDHARVTDSSAARRAALRLAEAIKQGLQAAEGGRFDDIAYDLRLWVPLSEIAETTVRLNRGIN